MSYGQFKFVLSKEEKLYIGYSGDFHADICGLLRREVLAAGYIAFDGDTAIPNGKSIGYSISAEGYEDLVSQKLGGLTKREIFKLLEEGAEHRIVIN